MLTGIWTTVICVCVHVCARVCVCVCVCVCAHTCIISSVIRCQPVWYVTVAGSSNTTSNETPGNLSVTMIPLIVAAVFTTGVIIFLLTLCVLIIIKRMCAAKKALEEDYNPHPIYADITQTEILMEENMAYAQFTCAPNKPSSCSNCKLVKSLTLVDSQLFWLKIVTKSDTCNRALHIINNNMYVHGR